MRSESAAARVAAALAARVLWIEGPTPSLVIGAAATSARAGGPRLADPLDQGNDDARAAFAVTLQDHGGRGDLDLALPTVDWPVATALPSARDPRWQERAFVSPGRRPHDRFVTATRGALARAAQRAPGGLAATLLEALAAFGAKERRWRLRDRELVLRRSHPVVMAILNVTPDSFSDGGRWNARAAVARGEELVAEGAGILDVGGESTRPGSQPVSAEVEIERVLPVIEGLKGRVDVPLSIDTTKSEVARRALAAGATIVNDTSALADDPELAALVARERAGVVLMHRQGTPRTMQDDPHYEDCAAEVAEQLQGRAAFAIGRGIAREAIVLDPGLGFGKRLADNLDLVAGAGSLRSLGYPVLLGASRKGFLGALTGRSASAREAATLATTAVAFQAGCEIVRVHDAAGSVDLIKVLAAIGNA